jgi:hypothetical protein
LGTVRVESWNSGLDLILLLHPGPMTLRKTLFAGQVSISSPQNTAVVALQNTVYKTCINVSFYYVEFPRIFSIFLEIFVLELDLGILKSMSR